MKITCQREKLLAAFQTASAVVPARSPKPILQNVKIEVDQERAVLMATDLEVGVRIEVGGIDIDMPGSAILPSVRFASILRESTDEKLELEAEPRGIDVRGERSQFKLPSEDPSEFPEIAAFEESKFHEVPARLLRELIHRTVFATDPESTRYALGGVLLEMTENTIIAVGTDGRRLAKMEGPALSVEGHEVSDNACIVPTKAMQLIERAISPDDAEIRVAARSNDILVKSERTMIYSRLVEGRFPKWRDVIPKRDGAVQLELPVGPMHTAVRQAQILTNEESRGVDFTFGEGAITLSSRSAELGQSRVELPIAYDGKSISVTLDPRYFNDFLRVLDADKTFTVEIQDAESAVVCTTDDGYAYVIMPLAREA